MQNFKRFSEKQIRDEYKRLLLEKQSLNSSLIAEMLTGNVIADFERFELDVQINLFDIQEIEKEIRKRGYNLI